MWGGSRKRHQLWGLSDLVLGTDLDFLIQSWVRHFTFLSLSFLVCKVESVWLACSEMPKNISPKHRWKEILPGSVPTHTNTFFFWLMTHDTKYLI